jgi:curved DNA-binding protein
MEYKDYYQLLNLDRDATQAQIKSSYRKLARKYHPDISKEPEAEEKFKAIGEAYEVLKNAEKRAAYDQLGNQWQEGENFHAPPGWDAGFEFSGGPDNAGANYSDFFESIFGHGFADSGQASSAQTHSQAQDHHTRIYISIEDSYKGDTREVSLHTPSINSDGRVTTRQRSINLKIPKGVREGQNIRLTGQGMPGQGDSPDGDLYLQIIFQPHELYRVDGRDVYLNCPITPWEAALGAKLKIPTPNGIVNLNVPKDSQTGRKLRLKGQGIPANPIGHFFVTLNVILPVAETESDRDIYRAMEKQFDFNPRTKPGV